MIFKYYPRYASLVILILFNVIATILAKYNPICIVFYLFTLVLVVMLFSIKYVINQDEIIKYITFFKVNRIIISDIKLIEIVNVKQIGTIEIYIGKTAKAVKEDGYYLKMNDGCLIKIDSGYRNSDKIPLGRYIINKFKIPNKYIEKYKLFNDRL